MRMITVALALTCEFVPGQTGVWNTLSATNLASFQRADGAFDELNARFLVADARNARVYQVPAAGGTWLQLPPLPTGPICSLAYDTNRQRIVAVVLDNSSSPAAFRSYLLSNNGSWFADGVGLTVDRASEIQAVYDSVRGRTVIVLCDGSPAFIQTWEHDGATWSLRSAGGPIPRQRFDLAFDPVRGRTVLYGGGRNSGNPLEDTWEWDGQRWIEFLGAAGPGPRYAHSLCWHGAIQRVVLYGGILVSPGGTSTQSPTDTWLWDGASWTQAQMVNDPGGTLDRTMAWDPVAQAALLTGTRFASDLSALTFQTPLPPSFATFGSGCAGTSGVPALDAFQGDLPYVNEVFSLEVAGIGSTPFNVPFGIIGSSNTQWGQLALPLDLSVFGFSGCTGYVSPDIVSQLANTNGIARWDLSIPNVPTLAGGAFFVQALVLDPGSTVGGAVVSNAARGVVGRR